MLRRFAAPVTLAATLTLGGMAAIPARAVEPEPPAQLISAEEALGIAVRQKLDVTDRDARAGDKEDREALSQFYVSRNNAPMWVGATGITPRGRALAEEIARAADWGLDPKEFALPPLDLGAAPARESLVDAEAKLSLAALRYARHARGGRIPNPRDMSSYLDRDPQIVSPVKVLEKLSATDDPGGYLAGLNPQHEAFKRLRAKLLEIRGAEKQKAAAADEPVRMPEDGPTLSPGQRHPHVAILRQRLKVLPSEADAELYDDALLTAVKTFQRENGMTADGLVGRRTRASFNGDAPEKRKVDDGLLIANMEAWRWMPEDMGETHVWVNLPEFMVRVVKNGAVIHEERIISGKVDNQTPVFSHEMETVVLHPFWGVPESIKVKELLPSLARGSSLSRQGLRLQYNGRDVDPTQIDWSRADIRNYHVYQPPGGSNVLGVVKFLFPNKHQVYMHDTPTKDLFNTSTRTYSHGCMRVRNPVKLAEVVLQEDKGWDAAKVADLLRSGPENNNIALEKKIPVHVTYFTAWVDDAGQLQSRPDMYSHEKRIRLALAGKWNQIPRHRDHLAPVPYVRPQIVQNEYGSNSMQNFFQNLFGGF
ncbi:MAG: L,D-transpeptidase family protein [Hyphomicrobiaceae bacterium]|nr:L,D-transpeptidase family protein [Hyphomicrobiaceae bacterium]